MSTGAGDAPLSLLGQRPDRQPLAGLDAAQRRAASHARGPLLVAGGPGTGKTRTLVARFAWLVERGQAPEHILVLTSSPAGARALRERVEALLDRPYEELVVATVHDLCTRLLRDEALEAGLDPFFVALAPADRLAMLLEHIDELSLRQHDVGASPAALLGSFIARIDHLKEATVVAEDYAAWAAELPEEDEATRGRAAREREFAAVFAAHDQMLARTGGLDSGDLILHARRLLGRSPAVRTRMAARFRHVLVDELEDMSPAQLALIELLAREHGELTVCGEDDESIRARLHPDAVLAFTGRHRGGTTVRLERSHRCPQGIRDAARAVIGPASAHLPGAPGGEVAFWRCDNERAQAQSVAGDVERLVTREGVAPERIGVLVRSVADEGEAVAVALEERGVAHRIVGAAAFFQRAEVRDLLAWLRLLADPGDAGAVVRALARPPIELRSVDIARCTQIARRRKLDMVAALVAATESPQIPPEARERILGFLKLYRAAATTLDTSRPDLFVHRLIERLALRRQLLFAATTEAVERLSNLARFGDLAAAYARREPQATPREFARYIAAVAETGLPEEESAPATAPGAVQILGMRAAKGLEADHVYVLGLHAGRMPGPARRAAEPIPAEVLPDPGPLDAGAAEPTRAHELAMRRLLHVAMTRARRRLVLAYPQRASAGAAQFPSPFVEAARAALHGEWDERAEELFGPTETLHSTFRILRDELLDTVARVGSRLGELRLDTDLDVSHAVVRYLELVKLAALIERTPGQGAAEALPEINARLLQAVTAEQREIFSSSALDDYLLDADRDERTRARAIAAREEPSLKPFLPRRGEGLALSASDIDTYRTCPLKYKFARVFRIPQEPTLNQRFGILVHQVLERFHAGSGPRTLDELLGLLDAGWRRGGFGDSEQERQLHEKAVAALMRYHDRFAQDPGEPLWFERPFSFRVGAHTLRGRVDRVDRLPAGGYELIDYKTGRPKTPAELRDDVQLSVYALGAREAWQLEAAMQSYYYVLDDAKVPVSRGEGPDRDWITETVLEVGEGILSQGFEPTPSYAACSVCDYRIVCPAAER